MSSPVLIYQPGGGVSGGPVSNPPVYSQADTTALIEGQAYVDVVFGALQVDTDWVLVACEVENTTDFEPLNIWPGIITDKTTAGFRIQLNGMPDSGNYYLSWAVSGVNITPVPATTYAFLGPTSAIFGAGATYTVKLLPSTTTVGVTITPNDGGDGGVFAPASVTLTEGAPIQTFTYMPASFGAKTLGVINSGVLTDPTNIICTVAPVEYALAGPSSGDVGVASTNFHVSIALESSIPGTVTVTPDDGGAGGTFTPTTVDISDSSRDAYFTYTAAGAGDIIISVTNDGGLIDPDSLTYAAVVAGLVDGDPVGTWSDSSVNGNDATQTGSARPTFKTNIVNSLPVVRFTAVGLSGLNLTTPISGTPWTVFAVLKAATAASIVHSVASGPSPGMLGTLINSDTKVYCADKVALKFTTTSPTTAFHVITTTMDGAGSGAIASDGTVFGLTNVGAPTAGNFDVIGWRNSPIYSDGDVAEIIVYAGVTVIVGDIHNIEKYLGDKYGITVASGSAVQPDTVTGLVAWWKADSLL